MPLSFRLPLPFGLIPLNQNPEWQALGFEKYIFAGGGKNHPTPLINTIFMQTPCRRLAAIQQSSYLKILFFLNVPGLPFKFL